MVEPAGAAPETPLVIALHGRGDKAEKFASVAESLGLRVRTIVARGPVAWGRFNGRQWWNMSLPAGGSGARIDQTTALAMAVDRLDTLLAQLEKTYPKAGKPVVYGFSQGGMLALQALARRPGRFKAVAALSARLPSAEGNAKPSKAQIVPVLLTAGAKDRVITAAQTATTSKSLEVLGYAPVTVGHAEGHTIGKVAMAALRDFIREHTGLK